jgi:hypothetical protein
MSALGQSSRGKSWDLAMKSGGRIIDRQKAAHRLANGLIEYLML